jgi:hypothetical protein
MQSDAIRCNQIQSHNSADFCSLLSSNLCKSKNENATSILAKVRNDDNTISWVTNPVHFLHWQSTVCAWNILEESVDLGGEE